VSNVREGVLAALQEHGSLAAEQIAESVGSNLDAVHAILPALRERGLIDAVALTRFEGEVGVAVAYWRLTEAGHRELARLRAAG